MCAGASCLFVLKVGSSKGGLYMNTLLLLSALVCGQTWQPVYQGEIVTLPADSTDYRRWPMVCRVKDSDTTNTGVLVYKDNEMGKVLTVWRGLSTRETITCEFPALQKAFEGRVAYYDRMSGLAVIAIKAPECRPARIARNSPDSGCRLVVAGWSGNSYRARAVIHSRYTSIEDQRIGFWFKNTLRRGELGGAVFNWEGGLVGIVVDNKESWTAAICGQERGCCDVIRKMCDHDVVLIEDPNLGGTSNNRPPEPPDVTITVNPPYTSPGTPPPNVTGTIPGPTPTQIPDPKIGSVTPAPQPPVAIPYQPPTPAHANIWFWWWFWLIVGLVAAVACVIALLWFIIWTIRKLRETLCITDRSQRRLAECLDRSFTGRPPRGEAISGPCEQHERERATDEAMGAIGGRNDIQVAS